MRYTWLIVEDSQSELYLLEKAIRDSALPIQLYSVPNGDHALGFLRREGAYTTAPPPHLILLTIYVASRNGLETLAEIKTDPRLRRIPVVMWSMSARTEDIDTSYALGANAYVRKPTSLGDHDAMVNVLFHFWCRAVELPSLP